MPIFLSGSIGSGTRHFNLKISLFQPQWGKQRYFLISVLKPFRPEHFYTVYIGFGFGLVQVKRAG